MKKSEMNDIQKANYEYMRSLGIKKSWAKRLVAGDGSYADSSMIGVGSVDTVPGFAFWDKTEEGHGFWRNVYDNADELLTTKSYYQALLEIPNKLVQKAE